MPIFALTGFVIFALLAFGLRGWIHYRRTGTTGFVGISGSAGSVEWLGGVSFAIALLAALAAPVAQLGGLVSPSARIDGVIVHAAGVVLFCVGLGATLWAQFTMGDSWRIGVDASERTTLVAVGPFRWVRNPIFTAMGLAMAGMALLVPNAFSFTSLAALVVALEIQVRLVEEPHLTRVHGEDYLRYARSTGRFLPGIGRSGARSGAAATRSGRVGQAGMGEP